MSQVSPIDDQPAGRKFVKNLLKILFSHVGLFLLVAGYVVGGAYLFQHIEWENYQRDLDDAYNTSYDLEAQRAKLAQDLWMYKWAKNFNDTVQKLVNEYHDNITRLITTKAGSYLGVPFNKEKDLQNGWNFASSLLFTITIVTTIGYGTPTTPHTATGQLTTIFYALIGVPLMLMFLANIGEAMAEFFRKAYGRGCCYICWKKRDRHFKAQMKAMTEIKVYGHQLAQNNEKPGTMIRAKDGSPGPTMQLDYPLDDPNDETINVPISLTLVVIAAYVFLGAVLFYTWNDGWSLIKGAYFSFVTLATIGFGDLVPGWDDIGTTKGNVKMFMTIVYIVFGLAVLSMSFNLMMEEMFSKFRWLGQKMGIVNDPTTKTDDKKPLINGEQHPQQIGPKV